MSNKKPPARGSAGSVSLVKAARFQSCLDCFRSNPLLGFFSCVCRVNAEESERRISTDPKERLTVFINSFINDVGGSVSNHMSSVFNERFALSYPSILPFCHELPFETLRFSERKIRTYDTKSKFCARKSENGAFIVGEKKYFHQSSVGKVSNKRRFSMIRRRGSVGEMGDLNFQTPTVRLTKMKANHGNKEGR